MRVNLVACTQHPGCSKTAKYGPRDATPTACQAHKRAGQFTTNRHGELLKATRDGTGTLWLLLLLMVVVVALLLLLLLLVFLVFLLLLPVVLYTFCAQQFD